MRPKSLIMRIYGEKRNNQWSLICLEFNLAAQADTLDEAKIKLHSMITSYLEDVLAPDGPDRSHAADFLLHRRAPLWFWLKFYIFSIISHVRGKNGGDGHLVSSDAIPMVPSGA